MKLYYMPGACSLATHIALEWTGARYETRRLAHGDLKTDAYLRVNPQGAVPALELDDGTVLTQNAAVLAYLADSHPDAKLEGDGTPKGRAEVHRWFGLVNSDMHPAYKPLFGSTAYLEDDAAVEKTRAHAKRTVRSLFEIVDGRLAGRDWIAGARSIADPYLYVMTRWTDSTEIDISDLSGVARFRRRMSDDPGVAKALAAEGLV